MADRIGVISGTGLVDRAKELDFERVAVETPFGPPSSPLMLGDWGGRGVALLVRHGLDHSVPPHRLNHRANVEAMGSAGVSRLVLVASAGSLRMEMRPPAIVLVDDFISPFQVPTFHDDGIVHITPVLSDRMRQVLMDTARELDVELVGKGVYVQTLGPRLETRSEVRLLKGWGDLVGMTLASEATLAMERGMEVTAICSVDNMAHGLTAEPLEYRDIKSNACRNWENIERLLEAAASRL